MILSLKIFIITVFIGLAYSGVYAHHQITVLGLACMTVISLFIIEIIQILNFLTLIFNLVLIPLDIGWNAECFTNDNGEILKSASNVCIIIFLMDLFFNFFRFGLMQYLGCHLLYSR